MKANKETNALFRASHLMILVTFSALLCALTAETFLMNWEKWALIPIFVGLCFCWYVHVRQMFTGRGRLTIYVVCMMVTMFFYGIHPTSAFDLALTMCVTIILCTTTGIKFFITLCQITYYVTFAYDFVWILRNTPEELDSLVISRTALHLLLVLVAGWLARLIIDRWAQVLDNTEAEVEQLTEATGRLNDFLTSVSHEIRTPINAVQGLSGICLERTDDPEQREHLLSIQGAGKRMTELITDILDYSDIDRGRLFLNEEDYMLSSLLHDLVTELEPYMKKGVELIIDVDPAIPSVMHSDVVKLKKILWHLTTNALKFTKEGGVYVHVTAEEHDYGINLLLDVLDTGIGMTEEEQERLYEGFYQADSSRTRSSGGLGLGMAVVSGFVAALGGFIRIESRLGEGTAVHVCLPQTVVDPASCMSVRNREALTVGGYLHFEKYANPAVREYYNTMVRNIVRGLRVGMHRVDNLDDLKKLLETITLTHLFVGKEEYETDVAYMERLAETVSVNVVADDSFALPEGSKAHVMVKPFYCFPVAVALNRERGKAIGEQYLYCRGARALVVDDEPLNLTVARDVLRRYGIEVHTAASGREAVGVCAQETFDIVFMDHMMPGMDGIEAMRRIRSGSMGAWKTIPMVALTANAGSSAREAFREAGFDAFLPKPIDLPELERILRGVLPKALITYEDTPRTRPGKAPVAPDAPPPSDPYAPLRAVGVDIAQGLRYCQDDDEFYAALLRQFAAEAGEKRAEMEGFFRASDLPNYAIRIHALKSTAKMVGANLLSEEARALEEASKAGQAETVAAGHPTAMEDYAALTNAIFEAFGGAPAGEDPAGEDAALEFAPEAQETDVLEFDPEEVSGDA